MSEELSRPSYSRFGRRLDQQRTPAQGSYSPATPITAVAKKQEPRKVKPGADWIFRKVERMAPTPENSRVYNPHYEILEKHVPSIQFAKLSRRRISMDNPELSVLNTSKTVKVRMIIPFDKQVGRIDKIKPTIDTFYNTSQSGRNKAHSFDSYSCRKPLAEREALPDYDILKTWQKTRNRVLSFNFSQLNYKKNHIPITAQLDYDVRIPAKTMNLKFTNQIPREPVQKPFKNLFPAKQ